MAVWPAMLRFVDRRDPGITRRRRGARWQYFDAHGARIADEAEIARLNALAVPPAYADVWFCPEPDGHLQAVGTDARGRLQYRYHPDFRAGQEAAKFDRCAAFGSALPAIRKRVASDLQRRGLPRDKVLAAVVRLLDEGRLRIGNDAYARENRSYGATTLRSGHARVTGGKVRLCYRGKHGKTHEVMLADRALARIVRRCQDLPGQHLFQFEGDDGAPHRIGSADVNGYLQDVMGEGFSAKHFRTWGASVIAFETIRAADGDIKLKQLLDPVSAALGNTPAIARKSYVHPALIDAVRDGEAAALATAPLPRATRWLSREERGLIAFLEGRAVAR